MAEHLHYLFSFDAGSSGHLVVPYLPATKGGSLSRKCHLPLSPKPKQSSSTIPPHLRHLGLLNASTISRYHHKLHRHHQPHHHLFVIWGCWMVSPQWEGNEGNCTDNDRGNCLGVMPAEVCHEEWWKEWKDTCVYMYFDNATYIK